MGVIGNLAIKELKQVTEQLAGIIAKREAKKEAPAAPAKTDAVSSALQTSAAKHITPATKI